MIDLLTALKHSLRCITLKQIADAAQIVWFYYLLWLAEKDGLI